MSPHSVCGGLGSIGTPVKTVSPQSAAERPIELDGVGFPDKARGQQAPLRAVERRSEEHTSELQSLMRISYAVFCLKKKKQKIKNQNTHNTTILNTAK